MAIVLANRVASEAGNRVVSEASFGGVQNKVANEAGNGTTGFQPRPRKTQLVNALANRPATLSHEGREGALG